MLDSIRERVRIWPGLLVIAAVFATVSLVFFGGCGSSASIRTLDSQKIERAIERSSLAQRGAHAQVSCPSNVPQKKGLAFSCIANVGDTSTRFVVTQPDETGHVRYEAP